MICGYDVGCRAAHDIAKPATKKWKKGMAGLFLWP
jgi:hypothetical protein